MKFPHSKCINAYEYICHGNQTLAEFTKKKIPHFGTQININRDRLVASTVSLSCSCNDPMCMNYSLSIQLRCCKFNIKGHVCVYLCINVCVFLCVSVCTVRYYMRVLCRILARCAFFVNAHIDESSQYLSDSVLT